MREGWKENTHREEGEKKIVGVFEKALGQGFNKECHTFEEY